MYGNQTLEDDGPRRVPKSVLKSAEDLADTSLARVRSYQDMLDVLRLRGSSLQQPDQSVPAAAAAADTKGLQYQDPTRLDLGGALDGLLKRARHLFSQVR